MRDKIRLRHVPPDDAGAQAWLCLPELTAIQELGVQGVDTSSAVRLLGSLIDSDEDNVIGIRAETLTASDRDALLADLHRRCWGDRIVSTLNCSQCDGPFDLSFQLSDLQASLYDGDQDWRLVDRATVSFDDEMLLKVPTAVEEIPACSIDDDQALTRLAGSLAIDEDEVEAVSQRLEQAAPIIDLEFEAACPECSTPHNASFDIQTFVLQRLLNERQQILVEVHLIAVNYGWSLSEIAGLPRSTRQSFARLLNDLH